MEKDYHQSKKDVQIMDAKLQQSEDYIQQMLDE